MRTHLPLFCLILSIFLAAPLVAQEPASEEERALLDAALTNWEAAPSWRADFTFALQIDGEFALPGLNMTIEMDALEGDGNFVYREGGAEFSLTAALLIPLLRMVPEVPGEQFDIVLALQDDELHLTLAMGNQLSQEVLPLISRTPIGMEEVWEAEWSAAAEFEALFQELSEEHSAWWRLPDAAGLVVLQSELDGRALLLDTEWILPLVKLLRQTLSDIEGNWGWHWGWQPADIPDDDWGYRGEEEETLIIDLPELAMALGFVQLFVEEAALRTTYSLDAEREELQTVALVAELILNLEALALLDDGDPLSGWEGGELRILLNGKMRLSEFGEALP